MRFEEVLKRLTEFARCFIAKIALFGFPHPNQEIGDRQEEDPDRRLLKGAMAIQEGFLDALVSQGDIAGVGIDDRADRLLNDGFLLLTDSVYLAELRTFIFFDFGQGFVTNIENAAKLARD